jgi:hypothetical protein
MVDVLQIKNRYWRLCDNCDQDIAKLRIKQGLRKCNTTAEKFISALNEIVGYDWVCEELFTANTDDYEMIYSPRTSFMWTITLSTLKIQCKEKITEPHKRHGCAWNTLFNVAIAR